MRGPFATRVLPLDPLLFHFRRRVSSPALMYVARVMTGDVCNPDCKYNLEYYLNLAQEMVDHGVHSLAIKV